jgi:hypothetical protein
VIKWGEVSERARVSKWKLLEQGDGLRVRWARPIRKGPRMTLMARIKKVPGQNSRIDPQRPDSALPCDPWFTVEHKIEVIK